ncbi:MAG: hypothetical protein AB1761_18175 [Pseudomonadota bacterium]
MDLKTFIADTLTQIAQGVQNAQEQARSADGIVNPPVLAKLDGSDYVGHVYGENQLVQSVEFDVAVVVTEASGTEATAKLSVASMLTLKAGGQSKDSAETTSRIRFRVPLALPVDAQAKGAMKELRRKQDEAVRAQRQVRNAGFARAGWTRIG